MFLFCLAEVQDMKKKSLEEILRPWFYEGVIYQFEEHPGDTEALKG